MPGVEQSIKMDWVGGLILYVVLALVVGLGIADTFLMAFLERIHEFGVLLSLGMRPFRLSLMVYAGRYCLRSAVLCWGSCGDSL